MYLAGINAFTLSLLKWIEATNAKGLISKKRIMEELLPMQALLLNWDFPFRWLSWWW
jgi:hypothetical protein